MNNLVWESVLSAVEKRVNHESFTTWFKPITFLGSDPAVIYLRVPDRVFEDWILNNYRDVLEESLAESEFGGKEINFEISTEKPFSEKAEPSGFNAINGFHADSPSPRKIVQIPFQSTSSLGTPLS